MKSLQDVQTEWIAHKKRRVKASTLATYQTHCRAHILPRWGNVEIGDISRREVRQWIYNLIDTGLSVKTVHDISLCFRLILRFAKDELDMEIPSLDRNVKLPPKSNASFGKFKTYREEDIRKILAGCSSNLNPRSLALMISICSGMRIGEICGLRWEDIDPERGIMYVKRTVSRIYNAEMTHTILHIGSTKTESGNRDIPIAAELLRILRRFNCDKKQNIYIASDAITPLDPRTFRNWYVKFLRRLGISEILRFHAIRHTFATRLIESGADVKSVSAIMGHANTSTTLNLYVHPSGEAKARAINAVISPLISTNTHPLPFQSDRPQ